VVENHASIEFRYQKSRMRDESFRVLCSWDRDEISVGQLIAVERHIKVEFKLAGMRLLNVFTSHSLL